MKTKTIVPRAQLKTDLRYTVANLARYERMPERTRKIPPWKFQALEGWIRLLRALIRQRRRWTWGKYNRALDGSWRVYRRRGKQEGGAHVD